MIATSVINEKFLDVAKRLPPPMNAEEEAFSKVMKQVAPAFAALRAGIEGSNVENATKNAAVLKQAFTDTEAFFKPKKPDATAWAADARKHVETIQAAVDRRQVGRGEGDGRARCSRRARSATASTASGSTTDRIATRAAGRTRPPIRRFTAESASFDRLRMSAHGELVEPCVLGGLCG